MLHVKFEDYHDVWLDSRSIPTVTLIQTQATHFTAETPSTPFLQPPPAPNVPPLPDKPPPHPSMNKTQIIIMQNTYFYVILTLSAGPTGSAFPTSTFACNRTLCSTNTAITTFSRFKMRCTTHTTSPSITTLSAWKKWVMIIVQIKNSKIDIINLKFPLEVCYRFKRCIKNDYAFRFKMRDLSPLWVVSLLHLAFITMSHSLELNARSIG